MTREEAEWIMHMCRDRDAQSKAERDAFDRAIEALEQEPVVRCKDCIHAEKMNKVGRRRTDCVLLGARKRTIYCK